MNRFNRILTTFGCCAALFSSGAIASSLSFSGGSASTLAGIHFDPTWLGGAAPAGFSFASMQKGATLSLDGPANVTYTYVGREAGYTNLFRAFSVGDLVDGQQVTGAWSHLGNTISFGNVSAGALHFGFKSNGAGALYANGSSATGLILSADRKSGLILFNDAYPGDRDFDDMIVRISVAAVPEPGSYAMLLAGLGIVGTIARRRRQPGN